MKLSSNVSPHGGDCIVTVVHSSASLLRTGKSPSVMGHFECYGDIATVEPLVHMVGRFRSHFDNLSPTPPIATSPMDKNGLENGHRSGNVGTTCERPPLSTESYASV